MAISSFFSAIARSFYSAAFYQEVGQSWKGVGIRYLLLLLLLGWIPFTASLMHHIEQVDISSYNIPEPPGSAAHNTEISLNSILRAIVTQLPALTIDKGELQLPATQPYTITDPTTGKLLMVIDTTGKVNSLQGTEAFILLTKRDLYVRLGAMGEANYTIADLMGQEKTTVNRKVMEEWIENGKILARWLLPLVFFPISVAISFCYSMFGSLCYSVMGLAIGHILKTALSFKDIFRLAVVARTPVIFFEVLSLISPPVLLHNYQNFIFFGLSLGYLFFAISANQPREEGASSL